MNKTSFRAILGLIILTAFLAGVAHYTTMNNLPDGLRSFVLARHDKTTNSAPIWSMFVVLATIITFVQLFRFKSWARHALVLVFLISILPINGPSVQTQWESFFVDISGVLHGIAIALVYWSPIRDLFEKSEVPQSN
jgi:hypothetical protein